MTVKNQVLQKQGPASSSLTRKSTPTSLVVEDLDVTKLPESKMKEVAEEINRLCEDLGIPGRVYLVPA